MITPTLDFLNSPLVDKNGVPTPVTKSMFTQFFTQTQQNLSNQGYVIPTVTSDQLAGLQNRPDGTLLVCNNELLIKLNGVYKTVTVS